MKAIKGTGGTQNVHMREHLICGKSYISMCLKFKKKTLASHCDRLIQNQGDKPTLKENEIKYSFKSWKFWLIGFVTVTVNRKTFQTILSKNLIFS